MMNMITYRKAQFDDCLFIAELKGIVWKNTETGKNPSIFLTPYATNAADFSAAFSKYIIK